MNKLKLRSNALLAIFLCCVVAVSEVVAIAEMPAEQKANKSQNKVLSRFVIADFERIDPPDLTWLGSQPAGYVDVAVFPKTDSGSNVFSIGVGQGRKGGNALIVESTNESMGLPGFWIYKGKSNGDGRLSRIRDSEGYFLPRDMRANRLSFWVKFESGFRVDNGALQPPLYPNHVNSVVGTYQFDPTKIDGVHDVIESDNWHFYHHIFIRHDKSNGDWINIVVNQMPQHQRNVSESPVDNPTALVGNYWELLTRFYFDNNPYYGDPEIPYPVKMLVDDIELQYVDNGGMSLDFLETLPGEVFEITVDETKELTAVLRNSENRTVCGYLLSHGPFSPSIFDAEGILLKTPYTVCLNAGEESRYKISVDIIYNASWSVGRNVGVSFIEESWVNMKAEESNTSYSTPYLEKRWRPETGSHDAVVVGDFIHVKAKQ